MKYVVVLRRFSRSDKQSTINSVDENSRASCDKCSNLILRKEIEATNEISLFSIFVLFSAIESVWLHSYHELRTLYSSIN